MTWFMIAADYLSSVVTGIFGLLVVSSKYSDWLGVGDPGTYGLAFIWM
jgi:hypothetical protein